MGAEGRRLQAPALELVYQLLSEETRGAQVRLLAELTSKKASAATRLRIGFAATLSKDAST